MKNQTPTLLTKVNKGAVALRKTYTRYYNILQDEFSFIIFGKGPYSPSAVFLRHPAFA